MFCPKCGEENNNEAKFCKRCGSSLKGKEQTSVAQETKDSFQKDNGSLEIKMAKKEKTKQTTCFIFSILSLLFFIVSLGLLFSNYVTIQYSGSGTARIFTNRLGPIDLLFNIWNGVKGPVRGDSLSAQITAISDIVDASCVFTITLLGFFALAVLSILGIYKETKGLIEKKDSKTDFILFLFLITTSFMVSLLRGAFTNSLSYGYGTRASIGEGPLTILLLGTPLLLAKIIAHLIFEYKKEERLSFASQICLSCSLFVVLSLVSQFKNSFAYSDLSSNNFGIGSLFDYRMSQLVSFTSQTTSSASTVNVAIGAVMAFLFVRYALAILIFVYSILFARSLWSKKTDKTFIISPSIMIGISILLTISLPIENLVLSNVIPSLDESFKTLEIGSALPSLIGGSLLLLGIGIASYLLRKNASKNEQPTK